MTIDSDGGSGDVSACVARFALFLIEIILLIEWMALKLSIFLVYSLTY